MKKEAITYQKIKERADKCGLSIRKVCKLAGVHYNTVIQKWKSAEPETLVCYNAIDKVLSDAEKINEK